MAPPRRNPNPARDRQAGRWFVLAWLACCGCHGPFAGGATEGDVPAAGPADGPPPESVAYVPVENVDWTWEQIADVVDDYFRIERERQVQAVGGVITEGRIDVFPQLGATALEPHRADSVGAYNCWESTLQTIRRRGTFTVVPEGTGWAVRAVIYKDLEDLPRPEHATAGGATFRNDDSLPTRSDNDVSRTQLSNAWIELGRDVAAERQILEEIRARVTGSAGPP